MRIGLDFDNTIVNYDRLFHTVAREQNVVPADVPANKVAVRDYLRQAGKEDVWTEMQGYVYGARMSEADAYPGLLDALRHIQARGHDLYIVSHKTKHPFMGPKYDLHAAASAWIAHHLQASGNVLVESGNVYFELTKSEKIARIATLGCDLFVDDLPEILLADGFPPSIRKILFDPDRHHDTAAMPNIARIGEWKELALENA